MDQMQFNGFAFRYNPRRLELDYLRTIQVTDMPFCNPLVQDLGRQPRRIRGEGEFFGADRRIQFEQLAAQFGQSGAGRLLCPLCEPMYAHFSALKLAGEAGPQVLRYSFEFVEDLSHSAEEGDAWS